MLNNPFLYVFFWYDRPLNYRKAKHSGIFMVEMAKVSKYFKVYVSNVKQGLVGKEFLSIWVSWALVWLSGCSLRQHFWPPTKNGKQWGVCVWAELGWSA